MVFRLCLLIMAGVVNEFAVKLSDRIGIIGVGVVFWRLPK